MSKLLWAFGFLLAMAVVLPSAVARSAGQPTREFVGGPSVRSWPAGRTCAFPLQRNVFLNREVATTFPADENGDVRQLITGDAWETFTNLDTGAAVTVHVSGPSTVIYHADGSVHFESKGGTSYELFVTDTPPGPDEVLSIGRLVIDVDPEGNYNVVSQTGRQISICAELS